MPLKPLIKHTRSAMVTIRFTPPERDHAEDLARRAGASISEYGRAQILGDGLPSRPSRPARCPGRPIPTVNQETYLSLVRAGNNLNQLARNMNQGGTPDLRGIRAALVEVKAAVSQVGREVVGVVE